MASKGIGSTILELATGIGGETTLDTLAVQGVNAGLSLIPDAQYAVVIQGAKVLGTALLEVAEKGEDKVLTPEELDDIESKLSASQLAAFASTLRKLARI